MADEYVDYSCSTPIERLTRDIETVLRSWHIQQTDRHVSHHVSTYKYRSINKTSEVPTFITIETKENAKQIIDDGSIKVIRSAKVTYTMTTVGSYNLNQKVNVDLDLVLWDGPPSYIESHVETNDRLPLSLSSNCYGSLPEGSILSNFCYLFGIGQHLSLSPSSSSVAESIMKDSIDALHARSQRSKYLNTGEDMEYRLQLYTSIFYSLSNQLQTALNVAVSNCECRIPAFGIWGDYYQSVLHSENDRNLKKSGEKCFSVVVMEIPSWMNSYDFFSTVSNSNNQDFYEHLSGVAMIDTENEMNDNVYFEKAIQSTPSQIRKLDDISKLSIGRFRNEECSKYTYVSPLVSAVCNPGSSFFSTGAKFSIYVIPPGIFIPLRFTSLDSFGRLLLGNCAKTEKVKLNRLKKFKTTCGCRRNGNCVIITDARYKYTWNKSLTKAIDVIPCQDELLLSLSFRDLSLCWDQLNIFSFDLSWRSCCGISSQDTNDSISSYLKRCKMHALKILFKSSCTSRSHRLRVKIATSKSLEPIWGPFSDPVSQISVITTWADFKLSDHEVTISNNDTLYKSRLTLPLVRSEIREGRDNRKLENKVLSSIFDPLSIGSPYFKVRVFYDDTVGYATLSSTNRCIVASLIRVAALENSCLLGHLSKPSILEQLHQREEIENITNNILEQATVSQATRKLVEAIDFFSMSQMLDDYPDDQMDAIVDEIFNVPDFPSPPQDIFNVDKTGQFFTSFTMEVLPKSSQPGRFLSILCNCMASMQAPSCMSSLWMAFVAKLRLRWDHRESIPNLGMIPGIDGANISKQNDTTIMKSTSSLHAAFVNSSGLEPCLNDCIINQKLMTFNIGVESMIYEEMRGLQFENMEEDDFFDAVESDGEPPSDISKKSQTNKLVFMAASGASGARCPIEGKYLIASKAELRAPYLQRDEPLTDDIILERGKMLSSDEKSSTSSIQSRIEAAQRLQKGKLISDMSAFKAANPGAVFQDFTNWYGNPDNPLEKYEADPYRGIRPTGSSYYRKTAEVEASEAMYILSSTRKFWSDCWDESKPIAAKDQPPLFDSFSTIEMILHWLEAIHPAVLINQVLAVNFANAYFILKSSIPSPTPPIIQKMMKNFKAITEKALTQLSDDITRSMMIQQKHNDCHDPFLFISPDTIRTCEDVCSRMADVEMIMSRAVSLLSKFDGDVELVEQLLVAPEGKTVEVHNLSSRKQILKQIKLQKIQYCKNSNHEGIDLEIPSPSMRQYVLRNVDENDPCQLTVCFGGAFCQEEKDQNLNRGGLVVALKKCEI